MMTRGLMISAILLVTTAAAAQQPRTGGSPAKSTGKGGQSLDQQLLDDLNKDLLDGLPGPTSTPPNGKTVHPLGGEEIGSPSSDNPLARIGEKMRLVQERMAAYDTSPETQAVQQQILEELAELLKSQQAAGQSKPRGGAGQGTQQAGNSGGNTSPGPVTDSTNRIDRGSKEDVEKADVQDVLKRFWGHLPEKMREQMQSSLSEQFLPKYERVIEEYYKRLAEERSGRP